MPWNKRKFAVQKKKRQDSFVSSALERDAKEGGPKLNGGCSPPPTPGDLGEYEALSPCLKNFCSVFSSCVLPPFGSIWKAASTPVVLLFSVKAESR